MHTNYFVFLHRPGPNWLKDKPITEQPLSAHFQYMSQLAEEEKLVVGGGFLDDSGAMGVIQASNIAEVEKIVAADPAVRSNVVQAEVHPWFVTVAGQIEKSG